MRIDNAMELQSDLGFCNLFYSSEDESLAIEKEFIIKAYNLNKKFFKIEIPKFDIKLVYSRKKFNKLWGSETQDYISAFAKDDSIVVFAYDIFDKETRWEKEEYHGTIVHEISHLFYQELRDDTYDPLWLSEGLATFMQHDKKKFDYEDKSTLTKEALMGDFEDTTVESYKFFTMFIEYLILEFEEGKLLELIEGLKNNQKLNDLFQKIYNQSFDELINNGNKYHKIT